MPSPFLLNETSMLDFAAFLVVAPLYLALVGLVLFGGRSGRWLGFAAAVVLAVTGLYLHQTYELTKFYHVNFYVLPLVAGLCRLLRNVAPPPAAKLGGVSDHQVGMLGASSLAIAALLFWIKNEFAADYYLLFFLAPFAFSYGHFLWRAVSKPS